MRESFLLVFTFNLTQKLHILTFRYSSIFLHRSLYALRGSLLQWRTRMPSASTGLRKTSNRNCYSPQKSSAISLRWDYMHKAFIEGEAALGSDVMWLCQPTNGSFFGIKFSPEKKKEETNFYIFSVFLYSSIRNV